MSARDGHPEGGADPIALQARSHLELSLYWYFKYRDVADPLEHARAWAELIDELESLPPEQVLALAEWAHPTPGR